MFVPFNTISPSSRIWIYQSDRKFSEVQKSLIKEFLSKYCERWAAHGQPLKASFDLRFDQFIVVTADESFNSTSGCSVDDSVRAIKEIEKATGLGFFDRNLIGFLKGQDVFLVNLSSLKEKYQNGIWNEETLTFNNLISTREQLETDWIKPAGNSWLKRYVPREQVKLDDKNS
jgi:hypothetical protein